MCHGTYTPGDLPGWTSRYRLPEDPRVLRLFFDLGRSTPKAGHYTQVLRGMLRVYFEPRNVNMDNWERVKLIQKPPKTF